MLARVVVFVAAVLAAGLATVEPHASTPSTESLASATPSVAAPAHATLDGDLSCAVTTGSAIGGCPRPLVQRAAVAPQPVIRLCYMTRYLPLFTALRREPALCGSGFRPQARVIVLIQGLYSATSLRALSDATGRLYLPLPWLPCALAPGTIVVIDHHLWSNALPLRGRGCL